MMGHAPHLGPSRRGCGRSMGRSMGGGRSTCLSSSLSGSLPAPLGPPPPRCAPHASWTSPHASWTSASAAPESWVGRDGGQQMGSCCATDRKQRKQRGPVWCRDLPSTHLSWSRDRRLDRAPDPMCICRVVTECGSVPGDLLPVPRKNPKRPVSSCCLADCRMHCFGSHRLRVAAAVAAHLLRLLLLQDEQLGLQLRRHAQAALGLPNATRPRAAAVISPLIIPPCAAPTPFQVHRHARLCMRAAHAKLWIPSQMPTTIIASGIMAESPELAPPGREMPDPENRRFRVRLWQPTMSRPS